MTYYLDTNYFLRFFLDDNKKQAHKVRELFNKAIDEEIKLVSSAVVILEITWVLSSFYGFSKNQIVEILEAVLKMDFINFENTQVILTALNHFKEKSISLEDCFHLAYIQDSKDEKHKLATFDKKLLKIFNTL
jgi:predicted nucleic-acid-binding protein